MTDLLRQLISELANQQEVEAFEIDAHLFLNQEDKQLLANFLEKALHFFVAELTYLERADNARRKAARSHEGKNPSRFKEIEAERKNAEQTGQLYDTQSALVLAAHALLHASQTDTEE